jgi:hypothetical protein
MVESLSVSELDISLFLASPILSLFIENVPNPNPLKLFIVIFFAKPNPLF